MGGDEGKDLRRDAVYVNEGVPPPADSRRRGRGTLVELRNLVGGEAIEEVSVSFPKTSRNLRQRIRYVLQLLVQSKDELRKRQTLSGVSSRTH